MNSDLAYVFAIASATSFAFASLIYAEVARRISPFWMNGFKATVALVAFVIAASLFGTSLRLPTNIMLALITSGLLGLAVGDLFLLTAYARMGAARTLVLFGFQPFFIGIAAHYFFGQDISWTRALALVFFVLCLFTFSLEKFRQEGHWEIKGLLAALIGVMFDNCGVLLTRWAFEQQPGMDAFEANVYRCFGAFIFFAVFGWFHGTSWKGGWLKLSPRARGLALLSAFLGTFLSLYLYLTAIKIGHLASISAVGVAGPILTSAMECAYYRKRPTRYLIVALLLFVMGFAVLTLL